MLCASLDSFHGHDHLVVYIGNVLFEYVLWKGLGTMYTASISCLAAFFKSHKESQNANLNMPIFIVEIF